MYSDGNRREINKQREQTIQLFFDNLTTMMKNSTVNYKIGYAFLSIENGECYDVSEEIIHTSEYIPIIHLYNNPNISIDESIEEGGIDSIMKKVHCIDVIFNLIKGRKVPLPHLISIKFTNPNTRAVGRLVFIDLMYSPFTPSGRDNTINSIRKLWKQSIYFIQLNTLFFIH